MATPATALAAPPSFLRDPVDQLGVPGFADAGQLTPTNGLYTGRLELEARDGGGRPWVAARRTLAASGVPVYSARERADGLERSVVAFASDDGGVPTVHLRLRARNLGTRARRVDLRVAVG
ncbi:hypothetical protein ACVU7I_17550, partial [Patulibacter sp. S7RM1-6]